jgi:ATP-binding cassette, subfamily C, bacterial
MNAGIFSLGINLLFLAAPLYMLQVYDRVISSASHTTLAMLTIAVLMAFLALAGLDVVRARILSRATVRLDRLLAGRVVAATYDSAAKGKALGNQPLRDFDNFRQFITGNGVHALFDLPWAPIYIAVIFVLHPALGLFALLAAIVLAGLAMLNERAVRQPLADANEAAHRNYRFTEMSLRNWEVVQAMGMMPGLLKRWGRDRDAVIGRQLTASDRATGFSGTIKFLRLGVQSLILGLGAYLVIERYVSVGAMFAATILLSRALSPVEQIVGSWRNLVSAREAYGRVKTLLAANPPADAKLVLPRPSGRVVVDNVSYAIRGNPTPILNRVTLDVEPGEVVGIIGPSGAGKSTLARHLTGMLAPTAGSVRLDGANVAQWPKEQLGAFLGYLPQDIELFADTVAINICRFREGNDEAIIDAARLAGVHDMILELPKGYDTPLGEGGAILSGGMRQRIGLARAVYGNPSLVVLDEPNSNLDSDGDLALANCIVQLKARRTTVFIISHRPGSLGVVDKILVMRDGTAAMYGPRHEVMQRLIARPAPVKAAPADAAPTAGAA